MQEQTKTNTCQLLTAKDAAKLCRLSKRSWFRLSSALQIPKPVRIGGSLRWRQSDIELWLSMNCPNRREFEARRESEQC